MVLCLGDGHFTHCSSSLFLGGEAVEGFFWDNIIFLRKDFVLITIMIVLVLKQALNLSVFLNLKKKW